jgi:hypothetical protein
MLEARTPVAALTLTATAALAQVEVVEVDFTAETEVRVDAMPVPLVDADQARDQAIGFPEAEVQAEIPAGFRRPGASSTLRNHGTTYGMDFFIDARFDLRDGDPFSPTPERSVTGSWGQRVVFDLDRRVEAQIVVQPQPFDDVQYTNYEPARLVGPDGEIVSGPPEPGLTSWIWVLELQPGRYIFEAHASYAASVDTLEGLSDSARHTVRFLILPIPCRADLDADGQLTIFDFLQFQNLFDAGDLEADFDGDGELTLFDFLAFQNAFDAGCE